MCLTEPPLPRDLRLVCAGIRARAGGVRGRPVAGAVPRPLPGASEIGGKPERQRVRGGLPGAPQEGPGDRAHQRRRTRRFGAPPKCPQSDGDAALPQTALSTTPLFIKMR